MEDKLNNREPLTAKVIFKYTKTFQLLCIDIDNELKQLQQNFTTRIEKINKHINLWKRFNLSGNIFISKTYLIFQLGYFLSVMRCEEKLMEEIQISIDRFVFKGNPWITNDKRYLEPSEGGLGLIIIKEYYIKEYGDWRCTETFMGQKRN